MISLFVSIFYFRKYNYYGSDGKESACNAGDQALIPGSGRSVGEGNGNLLQYSCLVWEIPWIEEPHGLQSMGSQRGGQDWMTITVIYSILRKLFFFSSEVSNPLLFPPSEFFISDIIFLIYRIWFGPLCMCFQCV